MLTLVADIGYLAWDLAEKYGKKPCLRDDHVELTYEEFAERTEAVAEQLAGLGIGLGDVVAIMLPNRAELLIAIMAAWRIGAAATPINPMFTANEADYQIADSGAELVITATADAPSGGRAVLAVEDLATVPPTDPRPGIDVAADDLALLIYTSGSSGPTDDAVDTLLLGEGVCRGTGEGAGTGIDPAYDAPGLDGGGEPPESRVGKSSSEVD